MKRRAASETDAAVFAAGAAARRECARRLRGAFAFADVMVLFEGSDEMIGAWTTSVPIFSAKPNRPEALLEASQAAAERFPGSYAQLVEKFYRPRTPMFRQRAYEELTRAAGRAMSEYARQRIYEERMAAEAEEAARQLNELQDSFYEVVGQTGEFVPDSVITIIRQELAAPPLPQNQ